MPKIRRARSRTRAAQAAVTHEAEPAKFDPTSVAATREFGVTDDLRTSIWLITTAADLSRGGNPEQKDCHVLAPIALEAIGYLYASANVPEPRVAALRRFMVARYRDEESSAAVDADPENPWWGRFDARCLRAPEPWRIHDLRGAARDFLSLEVHEFTRDMQCPDYVRLAARVALGALAAVSPDGTTLSLLPEAAAYVPREDEPGSLRTHAWLGEILTGTHGGDLASVAREGHRLLAVVSQLAAQDRRSAGRRRGAPKRMKCGRRQMAEFLGTAKRLYSAKELRAAMEKAGMRVNLRRPRSALSWIINSPEYSQRVGSQEREDGTFVYGPKALLARGTQRRLPDRSPSA